MRKATPPVLVDTGDPDEAASLLSTSYCPHRVRVTGAARDFHAVQTELLIADVAVHTLRYGTDVRIDPEPLGAWVLVSTPVRGLLTIESGSRSRTLGPGESVAIDAHRAFSLTWEHGCELRTVRLPLETVSEAAALAGLDTSRPLGFELDGPSSASSARTWRSVVHLAESDARCGGHFASSPLLGGQLSRMVASTLLATHQVTAPVDDGPAAAPRHLRRAIELMERRPQDDLTPTQLAAAAGVGVRALQQGFRDHLSTTPMTFLRQVRLDRVHDELKRADPVDGTTVADIAHAWGFGNLGRFSRMYRERFGQLPSHTLRH